MQKNVKKRKKIQSFTWLFLFFIGYCQLCIFPFKLKGHEKFQNDCVAAWPWHEHFCPMIVDKATNESVGFPFEMGCPIKEPWEKEPTCFESERQSGWISISISCSLNIVNLLP